jgi:flagellar motor component MotA
MVVTAILLGGAPGIFVNTPSFLFVFGLTAAMLIGLYGMEAGRFANDAFLTFFLQKVPPNPRYATIARSGSRFAVASGAVGSLIGIIQMLTTLDDPRKIGGGTAVSMLAALYGILLSEFVFGFLATAYAGQDAERSAESSIPMRNLGIPLAIVGFIVFTLLIIVLAFNGMEVARLDAVVDILARSSVGTELPLNTLGSSQP